MQLKLSAQARKDITGWLFVLPKLICFLLFVVYPIIYAIRTSFLGFDYVKYYWIGFGNYIDIFKDEVFIRSIFNTLLFVLLLVPSGVVGALLFSVLINGWGPKAQSVFKAIFYIPGVTSIVSLILVWQYIGNEQFGLLNYILKIFRLQPVNWLGMGWNYPFLTLIVLTLGIGASIVVISAGLNGIPAELYESAYIDGAKRKSAFFKITLPMLKPTLLYVVVTSTIGSFQMFVVAFLLTGGGPAYSTTTMLLLTYREAFQNMNIGRACSMGVILSVIVSTIAVFQFKYMSSDIEY